VTKIQEAISEVGRQHLETKIKRNEKEEETKRKEKTKRKRKGKEKIKNEMKFRKPIGIELKHFETVI
jgi:hypothetical protein